MGAHDDSMPAALDGDSRRQRRVRFDPTINLGHLLTFVGFLATGMAAYSDLKERIAVQAVHIQAAEAEAAAEKGRNRESLSEIKGELKEIRRGVEDLARRKP